jgi:predicted dehydrogenase
LLRDQLRIGVCGIGSIGFRHARLLSQKPNVDLFLCDVAISSFDQVRNLPNALGTTNSLDELLAWDLDGLVIATPEHLHVEQAIAASLKGLPVLLEKPAAENAQNGLTLFNVVRDTGTRVLVGYVLRYAESMRLSKSLLTDGLVGTPLSFQIMTGAYDTLSLAKSRFSTEIRNRLFADYSHEWDYLTWFLGDVNHVVASSHEAGNLELSQRPNVVEAIIEMKSGATGTVHIDYVQLPSYRHIRVIGDKGRLEIDMNQNIVSVHPRGELNARTFQAVESRDKIFERQLDHFMDVIALNTQPMVTVHDGLKALKVADALIASCESRSWQTISY